MKMRFLVYLTVFFGFSSCVDEISLSMEESNQALVIDAWMGNVHEDTYVKIYRTAPYISGTLNPDFVIVPVERVSIEEKDGQTIPFSQVEPTVFRQSASFDPQPGNQYRLVVETFAGEVYESSWETMPPRVEIEDIVAEAFEKQVMLNSGGNQFFQTRTFAEVKARITDPGIGDLGYLVQTSGITELYTSSPSDNCACACYEDDPNIFAGMNVTSNNNFQGRTFYATLGEIPLSYLGRYYVSTKVKVLNKSAFDYQNQINEQQRNSGSIFDPAPFRIKGNIKKRGAENELVLGGFFLFQEDASEKLLFRSQIRSESLGLNHTIETLPAVVARCDEFYTNATPVIPIPFLP